MSRRSLERISLIAVLALAFALRVFDLGRNSLWYDELLQLRIASGPLGTLVPQLEANAGMPLDYLVERGVLVFGSGEFLLRFPAAAFSTLSVALLYAVGKRLVGRAAGLVGAAFLSVSSFALFYAHEARPYALYMLLTLASFYWLYRALESNRLARWVIYALCAGAAVLTHLFALFVVVAQVVFVAMGLGLRALAPTRAQRFSRIRWWTVLGVVAAVVLFGVAASSTPNFRFVPGSALRFAQFLFAPRVPPPEDWRGIAPGESPPLLTPEFIYARVLENFSGGGSLATTGMVGLAVCGLGAFRRKPWATYLLVLWTILPTTLIYLFLVHRATLFAARYLIAALPAWLLLCALGTLVLGDLVSRIGGHTPVLRYAAVVLLTGLWIGISLERSAFVLDQPKEEWRAAGQFLEAHVRQGDAVLAPGGGSLIYQYAPHARQLDVPADVLEPITQAEAQHARQWLVLTRYVFDPGGAIPAWLQERGALEIAVDEAIRIYYWRATAGHAALLRDAEGFTLPPTVYAYASVAEQAAAEGDLAGAEQRLAHGLTFARTARERAFGNSLWADVERRAGNLERAAELYRAALALDGQRTESWVGLARVYLAQAQLPAAHDALEQALQLEPNSYAALFFLGEYYKRTGQTGAANNAYARAAEIVPDLPTPP